MRSEDESEVLGGRRQAAFEIRPHPEALAGHVWAHKKVTWRLEDYDCPYFGRRTARRLTIAAMMEASFLTALTIRESRRARAPADMLIRWVYPKDSAYLRRNPSALAFAYGPGSGIGGDITFNCSYAWWLGRMTPEERREFNVPPTSKEYDPVSTMKHEAGHALGMRHLSQDRDAIMYPYYNGGRVFNASDRDYLLRLYESGGRGKRVMDWVRRRTLAF